MKMQCIVGEDACRLASQNHVLKLVPALDSGTTWTFAAGGAFGVAADAFSKALCTSLAQLRAVYSEAENAGISLGDGPEHLAELSLSSHRTTILGHCMYILNYTHSYSYCVEYQEGHVSQQPCKVCSRTEFACSERLPWCCRTCQK